MVTTGASGGPLGGLITAASASFTPSAVSPFTKIICAPGAAAPDHSTSRSASPISLADGAPGSLPRRTYAKLVVVQGDTIKPFPLTVQLPEPLVGIVESPNPLLKSLMSARKISVCPTTASFCPVPVKLDGKSEIVAMSAGARKFGKIKFPS